MRGGQAMELQRGVFGGGGGSRMYCVGPVASFQALCTTQVSAANILQAKTSLYHSMLDDSSCHNQSAYLSNGNGSTKWTVSKIKASFTLNRQNKHR